MPQVQVSVSPTPWQTRDAAIFFTCAGVSCALCAACISAARPRTDTIGFVLAPLLCLALMYENISLGVLSLAMSEEPAPPTTLSVANAMLSLRGTVQAFIIPLWLISLFEITYTVHKRRSANFLLGLFTFDQGHRRTHSLLSNGLRYSLWVLGVAILLMQLTVNSAYTAAPFSSPRSARFTYKGIALNHVDPAQPWNWQDAVDFIPWVVFLTWTMVAGASLWRYGSLISTDINATPGNAWCSIFVAGLALLFAWAFSPNSWAFPYATNPCELLLGAAMVRSMGLVESNLKTLEEWDSILTLAGEAVVAALEKKRWANVSAAAAGGVTEPSTRPGAPAYLTQFGNEQNVL